MILSPRDCPPELPPLEQLQYHSHFQPIYSLAHRRTIGVEGLLRAQTAEGQPIPPRQLFDQTKDPARLDTIARQLHLAQFARTQRQDIWLFINAATTGFLDHPDCAARFGQELAQAGIPAEQIVLEVLEDAYHDIGRLGETVSAFRALGCLIAVDDFGAGHSNVDRLWRLAPDIVKLDRSLVHDAATQSRARAMLPKLVALMHEMGALVLTEGVETEEEGLAALESECDFVQGFWFARPAAVWPSDAEITPRLDLLWTDYAQRQADQNNAVSHAYRSGQTFFEAAIQQISAGETLTQAAKHLLEQPGVLRCYLLDEKGQQHGGNLEGRGLQLHHTRHTHSQRFSPLSDTQGAIWSRRTYFQQAIASPGTLQYSRPYLSLTRPTPCITLSQTVMSGTELKVLCADLDWHRFVAGEAFLLPNLCLSEFSRSALLHHD